MDDEEEQDTSPNQIDMTNGRELPINCKARRRLFSEDDAEGSQQEGGSGGSIKTEHAGTIKLDAGNLTNEMTLASNKWNFDFKNEVALEGPIQWYKKGSDEEWVGMQPTRQTEMNMRKRKMDSESIKNDMHVDEQIKMRKQVLITALKTREFFENERMKRITALLIQLAEDDNQINSFKEEFREGNNSIGNVPEFNPDNISNPNTQDKRGETIDDEELAENSAETVDEKSATLLLNTIGDVAMASDEFRPEDHLVNLRISDINELDEVPERLGDMMRQNEATPRNEKSYAVPPARKEKSLKDPTKSQGTRKRIDFD